jgi:hypothetical protein
MNRIVKVEMELSVLPAEGMPEDVWIVTVTKEFAPVAGGGTQEFTEMARGIRHALAVAQSMITLTPSQRTDL